MNNQHSITWWNTHQVLSILTFTRRVRGILLPRHIHTKNSDPRWIGRILVSDDWRFGGVWRNVLALVLLDGHAPRLATLQAGILCLHRPISATESIMADSVSVWSVAGLLFSIATSLGLQLECPLMGLPVWERIICRHAMVGNLCRRQMVQSAYG